MVSLRRSGNLAVVCCTVRSASLWPEGGFFRGWKSAFPRVDASLAKEKGFGRTGPRRGGGSQSVRG